MCEKTSYKSRDTIWASQYISDQVDAKFSVLPLKTYDGQGI